LKVVLIKINKITLPDRLYWGKCFGRKKDYQKEIQGCGGLSKWLSPVEVCL